MKDSTRWCLRQARIRRFGPDAGPWARVPRAAQPATYLVVAAEHVVLALRLKRRDLTEQLRRAQPDEAKKLERRILRMETLLNRAEGVVEMARKLAQHIRQAERARAGTGQAPSESAARTRAKP